MKSQSSELPEGVDWPVYLIHQAYAEALDEAVRHFLPRSSASPTQNPDQCIHCWRPRTDGQLCDTHASEEEEEMWDDWKDRYGYGPI